MTKSLTVRKRRFLHPITLVLTLLIALLAPFTAAAQDYEMSFCAPLNGWPGADRERGGFDYEIAELIADELGAQASFTWIRFDEVGVRDSMHSGLCDLMVGMGEGVAGTQSSIAYLRTPYVFISLEERDLTIDSMDDPILENLTIGTYQFGTPTLALVSRGLSNRIEFAAEITPEGVDPHTPIINAVLNGTVDVGVVYGPQAGILAVDGAPLRIEQVRPEIDFGESIIQLSRIWTIGVRPFDEALRDRVNIVLTDRWDDVQEIFARYGVPTLDLPRPTEAEPIPEDVLRIGIIHPSRTPAQVRGFDVGEAARLATLLSENALALNQGLAERVKLFEASAPTTESAVRAAYGLIYSDHIDILIGGYSLEEARQLAALAAENDVVFLNAGSDDPSLRAPACYPTTLNVAPDVSGYLRGMVLSGLGLENAPESWFLVTEETYASEQNLSHFTEVVQNAGGQVVGASVVSTGQFLYLDSIREIEDAAPDGVILIMNEDQQELFLSQVPRGTLDWVVTGLPTLRSQSRAYLQRFLQVSEELMRTPRVATWDPALVNDVNDRFASRIADAMPGAAWTTYAAFALAFDAASNGVGRDARALLDHWTGLASVDVGKEAPGFIREDLMQLASTLYLVVPTPGAEWGRTPAARTATASVIGEIQGDAAWRDDGTTMPGAAGTCSNP